MRANPLPDGGVPFKPIVEHRSTRPAPFSFETRDKQRQAEKERKIQQVRNAWWCLMVLRIVYGDWRGKWALLL